MTSCWLRGLSEALLEQLAADDELISVPQAASSKPSSPTQGKRKSSSTDAGTTVAATSRDPRPLTEMQQLL